MNKDQKAEQVTLLKDKFSRAKILVVMDYKGTKVAEMNAIRRSLEKSGGTDFQVVKNTLARLALTGTPSEGLLPLMSGPNAVMFGYDDPVAPTKVLVEAAKDVKAIEVKGGLLNGRIMSAEGVVALSKLPSREQLLAMLLGTLQAPASNFVNLLAQIPRGLLNVLTAIKEQKEAA